MAFSLTIPDLLRQIRSADVDTDIYERCQKADRLCRQGEYDASLKHSLATVEAATRSGGALNIGTAFVYLAAIRHIVPRKDTHDQASRDAETAVKWLKRNAHHALIAHLICAQIYADDGNTRLATGHYYSAQMLATQLLTLWHRRNKADQEKYYQEAQSAISWALRDLQPPLAISVESQEPGEDNRAVEESSSPASEAASAPVAPTNESSPAIQLEYRNKSDQFTLNYYEISRVWINGQEYLVETVNPVDPENPGLRLLPDQKYIAVPDPASDQPQQYVLVKEGAQPAEGQLVVNVDPVRLRVWTNADEATGDFQNVRIMGIVEARLRLASSQESVAEDEVDEALLNNVDALMALVYARPTPNQALVKVYRKFLSYLRQVYDLEVIAITLHKTPFAPDAGHHLVRRTKNTRLPDGVIIQVVRNGYTREGKVVREAQVIVNQK